MQNQDIRYLEAAVEAASQKVEITAGGPLHAYFLDILGVLILDRFQRTGADADLENSIKIATKALEITPDNHFFRPCIINNLAIKLRQRSFKTSRVDDIEKGIQLCKEGLDFPFQSAQVRQSLLSTLGILLGLLFQRRFDMKDLEEAIQVSRESLTLVEDRSDNKAIEYNNLGNRLGNLYNRTGNLDHLKEAIHCAREAVRRTVNEMFRASRRIFACNLGSLLFRSYQEGGQIEKLVGAIKAFREAVELGEASGDGDLPEQLNRRYNLGSACYVMYLSMGSESSDLLKEASWNMKFVTSRMLDDHPNKAAFLMTSGTICETLGDVDKGLQYYTQAFENSYSLPIIRLWSARNALRIHRNASEWDKAILLAGNASKLLPLVCSRYVSLRDQQHAINQVSGFAADACSLFLMSGRPEEALQQLEFGRGLILSYLADGNSDNSTMKEDPRVRGLVERYENLRDQLTQVSEDDRLSGRRDQLIDEIESCAEDIREITEYKRFLLGPEIEEITSAATDCPIIVVNTTDIASHAIITWEGKVTSLPLEQLSIKTAPRSFRKILEKLESLGLPLDGQRRVWWIGTGAAGSFPFHAAGMHSTQASECTLMKVVSSYASSIKTLKFSTTQNSGSTHVEGPKALLFVGMPTTPGGLRPLPGVLEEESVIRNACGDKCEFKVRRHPTASEILDNITESKVVHFACHGSSNPRIPSESHLLLQKRSESGPVVDRLTVERLSKIKAKDRSFLAFLSACSTAEVKAASDLADEAIHLASIFQVAGFANTIGALWPASDQACVKVAKEFYRSLFEGGDGELSNELVARALHSAVRILKSTTESPEIWGPFVHYGA
ncbi:hypothetical protein FOC1_g10003903 [Fusarium oxysporum f. sp. cubense race 1]|uniref:CHAT domain-containing protein n=1 Tax=Fusarium oxysporum f. sp. cubense (strain race 1) TaxID=1229664 RepID=N4V3Y8_FUSC1|nr:hypothetical protein FOC1_g10003903 [Fusarium oxysporum f. sp. cubense race 1]